mmetsp:Transcript_10922/g.32732  ORF Transcript_10922/g.32732 Transcript_10922/m.32732 type:complete len:424 (-) Transcript_10922:347-1618(-)|eukprot:CAMPEP_0206140276 /NCGR_PEP_ID=MMETSP1473-20131121/8880_1 /ASSEMBLY_ACC=CAM_ASM_001109 /TAXON_ID=1461547 /ORGANISM="Stichococcus sp, Strain RCC1054" /LENGTH=423 /DNA_ID=CAMNT_0053534371 /DNA_START=255 /DNA_END=1526 /DNA_ORIENTATION=+
MLAVKPHLDLHAWASSEAVGFRNVQAMMPRRMHNQSRRFLSHRNCLRGNQKRDMATLAYIRDLPIMPLGFVSFPGSQVPLNIFEARYRVLFSTLLAGSPDVTEELIQQDSPFKAQREFGQALILQKGMDVVLQETGTILYIESHERLKDGRIQIKTVGKRRFRILELLKTEPVLTARVEVLDETEGSSPEAEALKQKTLEAMLWVWRIEQTMSEYFAGEPPNEEHLNSLDPTTFSFLVANAYAGQAQAQVLLQEDSTVKRLEYLEGNFRRHGSYLQAKAALRTLDGDKEASASKRAGVFKSKQIADAIISELENAMRVDKDAKPATSQSQDSKPPADVISQLERAFLASPDGNSPTEQSQEGKNAASTPEDASEAAASESEGLPDAAESSKSQERKDNSGGVSQDSSDGGNADDGNGAEDKTL